MKSSAIATRRLRAVESFGLAAEALGPITAGMSLFAVTRGQWSMIDAVLYCLDEVGPAAVSLWTWTVAEYEVEVLSRLRMDNRVTDGRLVIDGGVRHKNAGLIREWQAAYGPASVRYVKNHAKIATIHSAEGLGLLLRESMNLNFNPRFEQFDLTEGGADFVLVKSIEDCLPVLEDSASGAEVYQASKIGDAWTSDDLKPFRGLKVWQK